MRGRTKLLLWLAAMMLVLAVVSIRPAPAAAAYRPQLTRYPYLTDVVRAGKAFHATFNWATDRSQTAGFVAIRKHGTVWSTARRIIGTPAALTVNGVPELQWRASAGRLAPNTRYDYRVFFTSPRVNLLGGGASVSFRTPPSSRQAPFKFAVLGDWGATDATGANPFQADLDKLIASSGARFALSTGDVAYPNGNQTNYGDLQQSGPNISAVFAPSFFMKIGYHIPMFTAPGNHGLNPTTLNVWPEGTAARRSGGQYQMDTYSVPGTNTNSYPSVWYAFTVGNARFYVLSATWSNANLGTGSLYSNDFQAHWTATSAEYKWLASDLATHPTRLKFAVFHFPMYSDAQAEPTDTFLHGPGSLAALLTKHKVQMVFNGHAHIYERNVKQPGESFISYVTGAGGESLSSIGPTSAFDAYGIGWNTLTNTGHSTGIAPVPSSMAQVFSYLLVTVDGGKVTVKPINSLGQAFDVQTYNF